MLMSPNPKYAECHERLLRHPMTMEVDVDDVLVVASNTKHLLFPSHDARNPVVSRKSFLIHLLLDSRVSGFR